MAAAQRHGLSVQRQLEMVGRSASEMVMQLVGGSSRLVVSDLIGTVFVVLYINQSLM